MTRLVIVGNEDRSVGEARELMDSEGIHALPIVSEEGNAIGIVTGTDVLGDVPAEMPVSEVMSDRVYCIAPDERISRAAAMMREHKVHHLVVTDERRVIGILSSFDLLQLLEVEVLI